MACAPHSCLPDCCCMVLTCCAPMTSSNIPPSHLWCLPTTNSGQLVRVWTTPGTIEAAAVPLQLSVLALQHYQGFTAINQSRGAAATKWDLLAVPGKTGAVENWALLMMDPERCGVNG